MRRSNWLHELRTALGSSSNSKLPYRKRRRVAFRRAGFEILESRRLLTIDFGDAPDGAAGTGPNNYSTLATDNGPSHTIISGIQIGSVVDNDSGTLQNSNANADDADGALPNDEDGLVNPAADLALTVGAQPTVNVRVSNNTGSAATLHGWIDYNANGVFDNASERASIAVPNGTVNTTVTLTFPAVPIGFTGRTFARFRLSTDAAAANPTGAALDGEVEDYRATIIMPSGLDADPLKTMLLRNQLNGVPNLGSQSGFGIAVASIGDLDGDGVTDMVVGANGDDFYGIDRGGIYVLFMNGNGTVKSSQHITHNLNGGPMLVNTDLFGSSVASLGDLDGDGIVDLAVGAPGDDTGGGYRGAVHVLFMNVNGSVKARQKIASSTGGGPEIPNQARFGVSVTSLGDLDGDGVGDVAGSLRNAVEIMFMNGNGTVKNSRRIDIGGGPYGNTLASLGDIDGDGVTDMAVGVGGDAGGAVNVLFLNSDGTVKSSQKIGNNIGGGPPLGSNDAFGASVAALGDINGDGITDLAAGAFLDDFGGTLQDPDRGAIYVMLLNSNGTVKASQKIAQGLGGGPMLTGFRPRFGISVGALGDLDGDGFTDLAVGSQSVQNYTGAVYVLFLKRLNANPVFSSNSAVSAFEQMTFVMNVVANDTNVPPRPITYSLVGGADQSRFSITTGGALSFVAPPDFDVPTDANQDNTYEVIVQASNDIGGVATQNLSVTVVPSPSDFGDAPDTSTGTGGGNYQTVLADGGPRHTIVTGLRMGAAIDGEVGTLQNAAANADDLNNALPDDEDGVVNAAADLVLTIGAQPSVNVRVTNTTGTPATLFGWIDYNANGLFDNATERASVAVPTASNNVGVTLVFPAVPAGFTGSTYARFRLSTDPAAANPVGEASNGEVEDYLATISRPSTGEADSTKTKKIGSGIGGGPPLANNDRFGSAVASLGDLDGDGVEDIVVGAPSQFGTPSGGSVQVLYMNSGGTVKSSQKIGFGIGGGPTLANGDYFGHSITSLGDLNGDGIPDLAVGASKDNTGGALNGAVHVLFMNANGTVKSMQKIASGMGGGPILATGDRFGSSVASLGDLDGDGVTDLAVGAISDDTGGGNYRGGVHVLLMNTNGTVKSAQKIASGIGGGPTLADLDMFGVSVASLGDLDGDAVTDLAVGAFRDDTGGSGRGAVYVLMLNANGTAKSTQKIASGTAGAPTLADQDYFGRSVASLGDLDGDGVSDLAVGAYGDDTGGSGRGALHVLFLNANGTVKNSTKIANSTGGGPALVNDDRFASAVVAVGDLDSDGVVDLAVGGETDHTVGTNRGAVHLLFLGSIDVPGIPGDYNDDGAVDAADFVTWRKALGQTITLPNDSTPGTVTEADYTVWRANFGRTSPPPGAASAGVVATNPESSGENSDELKAAHDSNSTGERTSLAGVASIATTARSTFRPVLSIALAVDNPRQDALVDSLALRLAERRREPSTSDNDELVSSRSGREPADEETFAALDVAFEAL